MCNLCVLKKIILNPAELKLILKSLTKETDLLMIKESFSEGKTVH